MALPAIIGAALPIVSGIAGLFGKKESSKSKTSENFERVETGTASNVQTDLPDELLAQLGGLFGGIVGAGAGEAAQDATRARLQELRSFDPAAYAEAVTNQAASAAGLELESGINQTYSTAGGRGSTMARLVEGRLRNQTAANLGGIAAQARAQGEDIANRGTAGLSESLMRGITDIIAVTRGSTTSQSGVTAGAAKGKGTGATSTSGSSGGGLGGFFTGLSNGLLTYWNQSRQ